LDYLIQNRIIEKCYCINDNYELSGQSMIPYLLKERELSYAKRLKEEDQWRQKNKLKKLNNNLESLIDKPKISQNLINPNKN
jgi:hypothetical protein